MACAVRSATLIPAQLAGIVLVGGSSRIPLVGEVLQREFGVPTAIDTHPKHDIALGAVRLIQDRAGASGPSGGVASRPTPMPIAWPIRRHRPVRVPGLSRPLPQRRRPRRQPLAGRPLVLSAHPRCHGLRPQQLCRHPLCRL